MGAPPGNWTGVSGMAQAIRDGFSAWEEFHSEADEYRELDGERVLVLVRMIGRGKTSGLDLGQLRTKAADVFHIRGGKVTRLVVYMDAERALADLGLSSETRSSAS
jgi:ketosteroid isomerase-like protein